MAHCSINQLNARDYTQWLKREGISRAEHSRRVRALIHESPVMLEMHLERLKTELKKKHHR
jgi:hypothetical protein